MLAKTPTDLERLTSSASSYAAHAKASATRRAYRSDLRAFVAWCAPRGLSSLPATPETVALYLSDRADQGAKVASLERSLVAISQAHAAKGLPSPRGSAVVREVVKGIRRTLGVAQEQKNALLVPDLRAMLKALPPGLLGARDRALLLLGFAGAFRRAELVSLDVEDVEFTWEGLLVRLRRSKTDPEGEGRSVGVPFGSAVGSCPVRALETWLAAAGILHGALFRPPSRRGEVLDTRLSDRAVARVVQRMAKRIGLAPARYGGHSLRAGLVTAAAKAGKPEHVIMAHTGHRSSKTLRRYIREAQLFDDNAAAGLL